MFIGKSLTTELFSATEMSNRII